MPRLPVPRLPPGGSLGTPKILSTGATLHLGPIRLEVENWECRADFFSACKWGLNKPPAIKLATRLYKAPPTPSNVFEINTPFGALDRRFTSANNTLEKSGDKNDEKEL